MRRASMAVCLLVLLAPCAAHAQLNGPVPPADAPVVAGPLPDGTALVAFDRGNELCVGIPRKHSSCGPPPTANRPRLELGEHVFGAATAEVASVEVLAAGAPQTVPAGAGAYQGRVAGRVHFFLAAAKGRFPPYRLRMLDAQGKTVFATDFGEAPAVTPPAAVGGGRVSGSSWRAVAFQRTTLAPTPLDRGRTERITCVRVDSGDAREGDGDDGCSQAGRDPAGMSFSTGARCALPARVVTGLAGPAVTRIDALLGDGARRRVALRALPASFGDPRHAFAVVVGPEVAVRSLLVRGGRVRALPLAAAPVEAECNPGSNFTVAFGVFGFTIPPPRTGAGPLLARDEGDDLCVGLGTIVAADCQLPPADAFRDRIERRRAGTQTAILAVVTPDVSALRLHVDHGAPLTVPTSDLPGYTGRYAGLVKAATATVPGDRRLYSTDLLAADGHLLGSLPGPDQPPLAHTPRVIARLPGGVTVAASTECVQVRSGPPTRDRAACAFTDVVASFVSVPCAARRTVVVTRVRRPATGLTAVTTTGTVRGRRHGSLALAILPPRAALREIRLTGAARIRFPLPPAARQCGYTAFVPTPPR